MSQQLDGFNLTFRVDGTVAIAKHARVRLSSGYLVAAGVNEDDLGTLNDAVFADSVVRHVTVRSKHCPGTTKMIAASAIAQYADVYTAASGKMNDVQSTRKIGVALEAASGDGSIIEVLRNDRTGEPGPGLVIHTTSVTLTRDQRNHYHSNLGMGAALTLTLPQDAVKGDVFHFVVQTAQELRVDPGAAGAIYINGAKQTDDAYISADDEAESVTLIADGNGDWAAFQAVGTWTVV